MEYKWFIWVLIVCIAALAGAITITVVDLVPGMIMVSVIAVALLPLSLIYNVIWQQAESNARVKKRKLSRRKRIR